MRQVIKGFILGILGISVVLTACIFSSDERQVIETPTFMATAVPISPEPTLTTAPAIILVTSTPQTHSALTPFLAETLTPTSPPPTSTPKPTATVATHGSQTLIGYSFEGRPIFSYQFKDGPNRIIIVGGIHGGYEWNTILLAYELIDYFTKYLQHIPDTVSLQIIPSANPDGQYMSTQTEGRFEADQVITDTLITRFNGNGVDLNRNWACNWSENAFWRGQSVNPGEQPFSEPETRALRDFFFTPEMPLPHIVIFLHSAANGVYAAGCHDVYPEALRFAQIYGYASDYPVHESFDYYQINGDASDWLSLYGIPAISIELKNHQDLDWDENIRGVLAILNYYDSKSESWEEYFLKHTFD